jgi:hypothetical protein
MYIILLMHRGGGVGRLDVWVQVGSGEVRGKEVVVERRGVTDDHLSSGLHDIGAGDRHQEPNGGPIIIILEASLIPVEGVCLYIDECLSVCQHLEDLPGDRVFDATKGFEITKDDRVPTEDYVLSPDTRKNGDAKLDPSLSVFRADIQDVRILDLHTSSTVPVLGVAGIIKHSRRNFISVGVIDSVGIEPKGLARREPVTTPMKCGGWFAWDWWGVVGSGSQWIVTQRWVRAEGTEYWWGRGNRVTG